MHLDSLDGDEQRLRDLGVAGSRGREEGDSSLARGEGLGTAEPFAAEPDPAGGKLEAGGFSEAVGTALARKLIPGTQRLARGGAAADAAQS